MGRVPFSRSQLPDKMGHMHTSFPGDTQDDQERSERAHYVRSPAPWLAACSDLGKRHQTNQDAVCLAVREEPERIAVLAISDGVSSEAGSEVASVVATETAIEQLIALRHDAVAADQAFVEAFHQANLAVLAAPKGPSACTLIVAIVEAGSIAVANVGDSRAYWLGDDGTCQLLSTDDSMAQARIMLGMAREDAEQSIQAHAITKWLGRRSTNCAPSVVTLAPQGDGWLLLCSDGLWNYASSPETMSELLGTAVQQSPDPKQISENLVSWANAQGGRDNITVIVVRLKV